MKLNFSINYVPKSFAFLEELQVNVCELFQKLLSLAFLPVEDVIAAF